jgi:hypothetical protein
VIWRSFMQVLAAFATILALNVAQRASGLASAAVNDP